MRHFESGSPRCEKSGPGVSHGLQTVSPADAHNEGNNRKRCRFLGRPCSFLQVQIILFVGLLELFSESDYILQKSNMKHYMKGGKPGTCLHS